jgi:hypothetical protein
MRCLTPAVPPSHQSARRRTARRPAGQARRPACGKRRAGAWAAGAWPAATLLRPALKRFPRQEMRPVPVRSAALRMVAAASRRQGSRRLRGCRGFRGGFPPLTARQSAAPPRASRSERPRGRTYQLSSIRCVCPTARSAYIAGRITTGLPRRVRRRGAIACCNTRGGYAGAVWRRVAGAESMCRRLTGHSPSTHTLAACCGAGADSPCAVRGLVCRAHCKIWRLPRPRSHA